MPEGFEDWSGRTFANIDLSNTRWRETNLVNARFSGLIIGLVINDVEVAPLIDAEMTRRHPERAKLHPRTADEAHEAWGVIESLWAATKARTVALSEDVLQARVDDEWSCAETFRHLVFVTDAWITVNVLGRDPDFHPLGMPPSFIVGHPAIDADARPSWSEVVSMRESRMAILRGVVDGLDDADLKRRHGEHSLRDCLWTALGEEWEHNRFANRDLDQLTSSDR